MFKTSFFYTIEKLSPRFLSVMILPIILRLIKPELWAEITLLLAIQLFVSFFLTQGDENSILKFTTDEILLSKSIATVIKSGFIFFLILEFFGQSFNNFPFSIVYGLPFRFMFISTILLALNKLFLAKLKSLEMAQETFKSAIFEAIFINFGQLTLIYFTIQVEGGYNTRVIVTSYFFIQLVGYFLKLIYLSKAIDYKFSVLKSYIFSKKPRDFLNFSNVSFALLLSGYFLNWQDRFFVERIFGLNDLGIYSVALRVSNLSLVFVVSILVSAYARFWPEEEGPTSEVRINIVTRDIISISCLAFISISLLSSSVGKFIVPKSYFQSIEIIYLAAITLFLQSLVYIFTIDFGRMNILNKVVKFNLFAFFTQIVFYFFYDFESLQEVFLLRSITLFIFILLFFKKAVFKNSKKLIESLLLIVLFSYMIYLFNSNNSQFLQIFMFISGLGTTYFSLRKWMSLEN